MESNSFTALNALDATWRRKFTVIRFFLCTIVLVGLVTIFTPKTYKSDAKIFVRLGRENSTLDVTAGLGDNPVYTLPLNRESEINSITDMIQNKELYGRVVDQVGPQTILKKRKKGSDKEASEFESPGMVDRLMAFLGNIGLTNNLPAREKAIIKLQKKIKVSASAKSNVVTVEYETHDPELAQKIVSLIVDDYVQLHARIHRIPGTGEFLTEQTRLAQQTLQESEQAFEDFKTRTNLISVERQRQVLVDRIASLENQWMETEANRIAAHTEVESLIKQISTLSKSRQISITEGAGNEGIDGMRQELYRLQVRREELIAKYSPVHPQVKQVELQLAAAQKIFNQTESKMVESIQGPNKVYEDTKISLVMKEPALDALQSKSNTLKQQIERVQNQLAVFNANETRFLRLQRDMSIQNDNYKRHKRTLLQANMDRSLQENNISNLSICQHATLNLKPARPNKLINLLIAIFLGAAGGIALVVIREFRETSADRGPELESALQIPVVANIPNQPRRPLIRVN